MSALTTAPRSILRDAMIALHDELGAIEVDIGSAPTKKLEALWERRRNLLASFYDADVYHDREPAPRVSADMGPVGKALEDLLDTFGVYDVLADLAIVMQRKGDPSTARKLARLADAVGE